MVVFFFIAYRMSFIKTIEKKHLIRELKTNLEVIEDAPVKIAGMQQQLEIIKGKIVVNDTLSDNVQHSILGITGRYCEENRINLIEISDPVVIERGEYLIEIHKIKIEGPFIKLNCFIYVLEQQYNIGHIASAQFQSHKERRTGKISLWLTIYLQNIKKREHET